MAPNGFIGRISTLKKKAKEIGILCDVPVAVVCYGIDGNFHTWPEEKEECMNTVLAIKETTRREKKINLSDFLESKKSKKLKQETVGKVSADYKIDRLVQQLNDKVEALVTENELLGFQRFLDDKLKLLENKKRSSHQGSTEVN
ncbi:hypothetical protein ACFE04_013134 [Oxalis oulophora]